jgi:hypothetical protein
MVTAFVVSMSLTQVHFSGNDSVVFAKTAMITTFSTTIVWLVVTLCTKPESDAQLLEFYRRVQPTVHGWRRIASLAPEIRPVQDLGANAMDWIMGCTLVYCSLFGIGEMVLQNWAAGLILLALAAGCGYFIYWSLSRRGWETLSGASKSPAD